MKIDILYIFYFGLFLIGCNTIAPEETGQEDEVKTPVEVGTVKPGNFNFKKTYKGVTHYLTDGDVKSPISGYITKLYVKIGDRIKKNTPLFGLETKEAFILRGKNYLNEPDLKDIGHIIIRAPEEGIMTAVLGEENEYIQEGTVLGTFVAPDMFVFMIEVPAEEDTFVRTGKPCTITLSDGKIISGKISTTLSLADSVSQTESYIVIPDEKQVLPSGLQLKIDFTEIEKNNVATLPKTAILSDEKQQDFWVMKLINDTTAVKIPVKTGLENESDIEIISPTFNEDDRILVSGNYGLPDTAYVEIKSKKIGEKE